VAAQGPEQYESTKVEFMFASLLSRSFSLSLIVKNGKTGPGAVRGVYFIFPCFVHSKIRL
jgi:hypothetical protein